MLSVDQNWTSLAINVCVALFVAGSLYWITRWHGRVRSIISLAVSCIVCIIVLGSGFVLQPLIWETLINPPAVPGSLYLIEYQTWRAFRNLSLIWLTGGLIPGTALGMILRRTRTGDSLVGTCIAAILILVADDLMQIVMLLRPSAPNGWLAQSLELWETLQNTGYSLICDIIGGFVAGVACRAAILWIEDGSRSSLEKLVFNGIGSLGTIAVIFLIFCHPRTAHVNLNVSKYYSRSILVSEIFSPVADKVQLVEGSLLARALVDAIVQVPIKNMNVLTLGITPAFFRLIGQDVPDDLGLSLIASVDGHAEPLKARIVGTVGCEKAEDSLKVAQVSRSEGRSLDLNGSRITLRGFVQELNALPLEGSPTARFYVPRGQWIIDLTEAKGAGGPALVALTGTLDISAAKDVAVIFSAMPDMILALASSRSASGKLTKVPPVGLIVAGSGADVELSLPGASRSPANCEVAQFLGADEKGNEDVQSQVTSPDRFVVFFEQASPEAIVSIHTGFGGIHFQTDADKPSLDVSPIALLNVLPLDGLLRLGDQQITLRPGDNLSIAGSPVAINNSITGSFTAAAESRYVLLNNARLTKTLWESFDAQTRLAIITAFISVLGWLVKRNWEALKEGWRKLL